MKISCVISGLEALFNKAEISETIKPGSGIKMLPSQKELSRLAHLSGQLCALGRKSRKNATANLLRQPAREAALLKGRV